MKGAPVFVKVDEYKEIVEVLDMVKSKLSEIRQTIAGMNEIREEEDAELSAWNNTVNSIQAKIDTIDRMMFEPEQQY
jgi:hypothetical protein